MKDDFIMMSARGDNYPPLPPDQEPDAPVEEPPDAPHSEPDAPVREPGPEPPQRLSAIV